jgi:hypothetical protein
LASARIGKNHSPGGYMKIILAVLGLVVFAGCQDLGDYPDSTAPKTTTPGTTGTGTTAGLPVYSGQTEWEFTVGRSVSGWLIPTEVDTTNVATEGVLPSGVSVNWSRVYRDPDGRQYGASWLGTSTVVGRVEFFLLISNAKGQTRVKFTVNVVTVRQAVSQ